MRDQEPAHGAYGAARVTPQRTLIARMAAALPHSFTVDELAAAVHAADPAIGLATVYRAVTSMAEARYLERIGERDGAAIYARCEGCSAKEHHHHVVCEECGRVARAECPLVPDVATTAGPEGFVVTRHEVTLYGLCPDCANRGA